MNKIKMAIINASVSSVIIQLVGLLSTVVIARLLTPKEIGVFAISSALFFVLSEFKTLGAGIYLVREKKIDEGKIRSALGVTMAISFFILIALSALSPLLSNYYELSEIKYLIWIMVVSLFFSSYNSIAFSLLTRDLEFGAQRNVAVISAVLTFLVSILLIKLGFSYFSLAISYTFSVVIQFFMLNYIYRPDNMVFLPRFTNVRPIFLLGITTNFGSFIRNSALTLPDLVIGKLGTPVNVGIFSRGFGFVQFLMTALSSGVNSVSLSYFSKVNREGGDIAVSYTQGAFLFNGLLFPILMVASLLSYQAIQLLFGSQWAEAAPIASILMFWAAFKCVHFQFKDIAISLGKIKLYIYLGCINFAMTFIAIILSFPFGLLAVAKSFVVVAFIDFAVVSFAAWKILKFDVREFSKYTFINICIGLLCALPVFVCKTYIDLNEVSSFLVAVCAAIYLSVWLPLMLFVFNHPLFHHLRSLLSRTS